MDLGLGCVSQYKNCVKGKPCGSSCIAQGKQCRPKPDAKTNAVADLLANPDNLEKGAEKSTDGYQFKSEEYAKKNLQELGSGVEGYVYRDGNVAVKYLTDPRTIDEATLQDMVRAGELGVAPKVLGVSEDRTKIALELVDGNMGVGNAGIDPKSAESKAIQENFLAKIKTLDENGMAHTDLHSENVITSKDGEVKLIDGITSVPSVATRTAALFGRDEYSGRPLVAQELESYLRDHGDKKSLKAYEKLQTKWTNDENPVLGAKPVVRDDAYYSKMKDELFKLFP